MGQTTAEWGPGMEDSHTSSSGIGITPRNSRRTLDRTLPHSRKQLQEEEQLQRTKTNKLDHRVDQLPVSESPDSHSLEVDTHICLIHDSVKMSPAPSPQCLLLFPHTFSAVTRSQRSPPTAVSGLKTSDQPTTSLRQTQLPRIHTVTNSKKKKQTKRCWTSSESHSGERARAGQRTCAPQSAPSPERLVAVLLTRRAEPGRDS